MTLHRVVTKFLFLVPMKIRIYIYNILRNHNVIFLDYKNFKIKIYAENEFIKNCRAFSCQKEPHTVNWIENFIKKGEVLYDIGANIGAYSLLAARRQIDVYAFEPSFSSYHSLVRNILLNKASNKVIPINVALSSENGVGRFKYSNVEPGEADHIGLLKEMAGKNSFEQIVTTHKLDLLVRKMDLKMPNHIKVDVDGFEYQILRGAVEILGSFTMKSIQIEINEGNMENCREIINLLKNNSYEINAINRHWNSNICDYLFVKTSWLHNLVEMVTAKKIGEDLAGDQKKN